MKASLRLMYVAFSFMVAACATQKAEVRNPASSDEELSAEAPLGDSCVQSALNLPDAQVVDVEAIGGRGSRQWMVAYAYGPVVEGSRPVKVARVHQDEEGVCRRARSTKQARGEALFSLCGIEGDPAGLGMVYRESSRSAQIEARTPHIQCARLNIREMDGQLDCGSTYEACR